MFVSRYKKTKNKFLWRHLKKKIRTSRLREEIASGKFVRTDCVDLETTGRVGKRPLVEHVMLIRFQTFYIKQMGA